MLTKLLEIGNTVFGIASAIIFVRGEFYNLLRPSFIGAQTTKFMTFWDFAWGIWRACPFDPFFDTLQFK